MHYILFNVIIHLDADLILFSFSAPTTVIFYLSAFYFSDEKDLHTFGVIL